jgi:hypothetical protein
MKRYLQLLLLLAFVSFAAACKKDGLTAPNINGTWELRATFGPAGYVSYNPGNGATYTFSGSTYVQNSSPNTVESQGTFSIKTNAENIHGVEYNELLLNGAQSGTEIQVQDTTMSLGLDYNNGSGSIYAKIK